MIRTILEARFGAPPDALVRTVRDTTDPDKLDQFIRRATIIESLGEF